MQLYSRKMRAWVDPADVFVTLYANDRQAFWLDRENHPSARYSVMGQAHQGRILDAGTVLNQLNQPLAAFDLVDEEPPFSWRPGFIGWFDYLSTELDPDDPTATFTGRWAEAREAVVFDHDAKAIWFTGAFNDAEHFNEWVRGVMLRLALSGGQSIGYRQRNRRAQAPQLVSMAHSPAAYHDLIQQAQQHIAAGDVYQLCLTNRLTFSHSDSPLAVFLELRQQNPAPYAAFFQFDDTALVCSSPEQFLAVSADKRVSTKPIKGTRPRSADPQADAAIANELANNLKERAENLMIVDLMRNDLGRVAEPDSVTVDQLFAVEQYATVHQLVSTVSAQLLPDVTAEALMAATFPGGSMTGAPKLRAMQLIADLEGVDRGTYSGVAGHLALDGSLDLGMVIRSLVFEGQLVTLGVGGGITIDSDPLAEVAETELKAQALLKVLGADNPWQLDW